MAPRALIFLFPVLAALAACTSNDASLSANSDGTTEEFSTDAYTIAAGEEKYACFAKTLDHDLVVDRFEYQAAQGVHHLLFATTTAPEPDGMSECNVLARFTWHPMFAAGASSASLDLPKNVAHVLKKGTQLLLQLHLLNTTSAAITGKSAIRMHRSTATSPNPAGLFGFGTTRIVLPPKQTSSVTYVCKPTEDVDVFAFFPHMHRMGKEIVLEVGPDESSLAEVYRTQNWSFDNQYIGPAPVHVPKGYATRTTCTYDNTTDTTITFGESTLNEMCFLVGFVTGASIGDTCVELDTADLGDGGVPVNPDAGACGDQTPNANGIGAKCTKGGNECTPPTVCSLDQPGAEPTAPGYCLQVGGCSSDADCGGGSATCCAPAQAGGLVNICIPEACRPIDCTPTL